jgi:hypothetical protein
MRNVSTQLYLLRRRLRWACTVILTVLCLQANAQISLLRDYENNESAPIGTFQGINFREAGFSGLHSIPNTNGKEFWTLTDRGVNVDAANANPEGCRPTYDKIYAFPSYAPKIHRIKLRDDGSIQILQSITLKRPNGTDASGIINPTGFGSTAAEVASTDTVLNCANFSSKITAKDVWGIDSEGIAVDKQGYFWICEEGGPTIWKVNPNSVVVKRYTPYANLPGAESQDVQIDSVFKYRKNNRGFEGISIAPNGKIYAIIQSPILYPTKSVGEGTRVHRILEIDPVTNAQRMFVYLNDGVIGSGSSQIRLRDWKIGDMTAINDHEFLVLEAALRGTTDIKRMYKIDISAATPVTSGLYGGKTLEGLVDANGLAANGITPVTKTLFMDLLANGWNPVLDKAEGIAIINDSTIAINNDNDYGQVSPLENGIAVATGNKSHTFVYSLKGDNKLTTFEPLCKLVVQSIDGPANSCAYTGNTGSIATYSVAAKDAATFNWKIPARTTLISGQGTNMIKVKYQGNFFAGIISVTVSSACEQSSITQTLAVNRTEPSVPPAISGPVSVCEFTGTNTQVSYSIDSVDAALSYNWVVPANVKLVNGQGTTSIQVIFKSNFTTSNIKVSAVSGCGWSEYQTLKITTSAPAKPLAIIGETKGICEPSNTAFYYVEPVKFATSYLWSSTVQGAVISADSAVATINFPSFVNGVVSVKAVNSCGISAARTTVVSSRPQAPENIFGADSTCAGSVETYSAYAYPQDSTTIYDWSIPQGSIIQSGSGTSSITVLFGNQSGTVKVRVANNCGVSNSTALHVSVSNCSVDSMFIQHANVAAYPNPTSGPLNVYFKENQPESYHAFVTDVITGAVVYSTKVQEGSLDKFDPIDLSVLRNGIYVLHIDYGSSRYQQRIEIRH